jgi:WD40 repeat protein
MLTVEQEASPLLEINGGRKLEAVTFTANGECIVGGASGGLGVWRVKDGKQMATLAAQDVQCLAVSKDGRWIAAGTEGGYANVWDAKTFEHVFTHRKDHSVVYGVDFSPDDSTRLVTASKNYTAAVLDVTTRQQVLRLDHEDWVVAAKYSPQGDRIATATRESVRVYDSNDGRLLVDIPMAVAPWFNTGLLWSNNHLFVVSDSKIKRLEPFTGSTVSAWRVSGSTSLSCIALLQHGEFIGYSANDTVTFWDTSTRTRLGFIQHTQSIRSIACSPDARFLAIGGRGGKVTIRSLSHITVSMVFL